MFFIKKISIVRYFIQVVRLFLFSVLTDVVMGMLYYHMEF